MPADQDIIRVSAVVLRDLDGAVLGVRKAGTSRFMLPGGKPEPGESPADTAVRECLEEVSAVLDPSLLVELGVFRAAAANEADSQIEATVFEHPLVLVGGPSAEIEELRWLDVWAEPLPHDLAPLTVDLIWLLRCSRPT